MDYFSLIPQWREIIEAKEKIYQDFTDLAKFKDLRIELHNASWCPDCERETTDLLAMLSAANSKTNRLELISYEDKNLYKENKQNKKLSIRCLPTIVFFKNDIEIYKIEELSHPSFIEEMKRLLNSI